MKMRFATQALLWVILFTAIVLVYWPGLWGGFTLDDHSNILDNAYLGRSPYTWDELWPTMWSGTSSPIGRPLAMLSFGLNAWFTGLSPFEMKLTNLVIHLVNVSLVFVIARQVLEIAQKSTAHQPASVFLAALVLAAAWGLHPINLTSVLYVVQRMNSLAGFFTLLGVAFYLWDRRQTEQSGKVSWALWARLVVFTLLAILAKENGVLLLLYVLVIELVLFRFSPSNAQVATHLKLGFAFLLLVPALVGGIWLFSKGYFSFDWTRRDYGALERVLTQARVLGSYMQWIFAPQASELSLYHDDYIPSQGLFEPISTFFSILMHVGIVGLAVLFRKRLPVAAVGVLWFYVGHALEAGVFDLELVFEHRNYLPSFGLLLGLIGQVLLLDASRKLKRSLIAMAWIVVAVFAYTTSLNSWQWSSPLLHAEVSAREHPDSPRANYELGKVLAQRVFAGETHHIPKMRHAFEAAANLSTNIIVAEGALIATRAALDGEVDTKSWDRIYSKLTDPALPAPSIDALNKLISCIEKDYCKVNEAPMERALQMAMEYHGQVRAVREIRIKFYWEIKAQYFRALSEIRELASDHQNDGNLLYELAKLEILCGNKPEALSLVDRLDALNKLGQLTNAIREVVAMLLDPAVFGSYSCD